MLDTMLDTMEVYEVGDEEDILLYDLIRIYEHQHQYDCDDEHQYDCNDFDFVTVTKSIRSKTNQ